MVKKDRIWQKIGVLSRSRQVKNADRSENCAKKSSQNKQFRKLGEKMIRIAILFFVLTGMATIGLVVLANWKIPAPAIVIDKVIPNDKLSN